MNKTKQEKNNFCLANDCTHVLPAGRRKYCSDKCANRIKKRAYRANKATDTYLVEKIVDTQTYRNVEATITPLWRKKIFSRTC